MRVAGRPSRPRTFWVDPRFLVGVVLVVASVVGVIAVIGAADSSVQVYAARAALAPGDRVDAEDLVTRSVRLGEARDRYLGPDELPDGGVVISRPVSAGELLPLSAVGQSSGARLAAVVVTTTGALSRAVTEGSSVDLWVTRPADAPDAAPPTVLVGAAHVVAIAEPDGLLAGEEGASVELLVPRSRLAGVLEAIAAEAALSLVPTTVPVRG
ncbi:SAF domain-containing protein [Diaminobutyricimonas sp. LJ205]|uniref:SAF domain-containing protein n=1 Tax=Diaminobutyricimonas sp. LJ205 TaxID=2683590 RepID=UPI0012F4C7F3|nr:SAF domain-containing protein [Diaminobutyricimonas sp. LJ205]